jgi:hypothetical protein
MRKTLTLAVTVLPLAGCMVGPNYKTPATITAPSITYCNSACGMSCAYEL